MTRQHAQIFIAGINTKGVFTLKKVEIASYFFASLYIKIVWVYRWCINTIYTISTRESTVKVRL